MPDKTGVLDDSCHGRNVTAGNQNSALARQVGNSPGWTFLFITPLLGIFLLLTIFMARGHCKKKEQKKEKKKEK